jgi:predicted nucleic acid-binding protein
MTLQAIPSQELVLLDANIVLYALSGASEQCRTLLRRCAENDVRGIVTTHILAEIQHRLMLAEAMENDWIAGKNPARQLAATPERIRRLSRYEEATRDLLTIGLHIEPMQREDVLESLSLQRLHGLMTNDALLAAVARRLRAGIASADKGLSAVRAISVYRPGDLN